MELSNKGLQSPDWKEKGYKLFGYDREALAKRTHDAPIWVHFGAGNIFRGFPARLQQELVADGYDLEEPRQLLVPMLQDASRRR